MTRFQAKLSCVIGHNNLCIVSQFCCSWRYEVEAAQAFLLDTSLERCSGHVPLGGGLQEDPGHTGETAASMAKLQSKMNRWMEAFKKQHDANWPNKQLKQAPLGQSNLLPS